MPGSAGLRPGRAPARAARRGWAPAGVDRRQPGASGGRPARSARRSRSEPLIVSVILPGSGPAPARRRARRPAPAAPSAESDEMDSSACPAAGANVSSGRPSSATAAISAHPSSVGVPRPCRPPARFVVATVPAARTAGATCATTGAAGARRTRQVARARRRDDDRDGRPRQARRPPAAHRDRRRLARDGIADARRQVIPEQRATAPARRRRGRAPARARSASTSARQAGQLARCACRAGVERLVQGEQPFVAGQVAHDGTLLEELAQVLQRVEEVGLHGADRAAERARDRLVRQLMVDAEDHRQPLLLGQPRDGRLDAGGVLRPAAADRRGDRRGRRRDRAARSDRAPASSPPRGSGRR